MSQDDETVERVARALAAEASTTEMGNAGFNAIHRKEYVEICWRDHEDRARAAIELIAKLNKLATYLTEQGEYEAVDLIDTVVARVSAMPERKLLREALEALQLIANATHPKFLAEHDIHLLHVSEKTFGDCINIARAAADKIRAALTQEKQT